MFYLKVERTRPSVTVLHNRNIIPGEHIHGFESKERMQSFLNDPTTKEHLKLGILKAEPIVDIKEIVEKGATVTVKDDKHEGANIKEKKPETEPEKKPKKKEPIVEG